MACNIIQVYVVLGTMVKKQLHLLRFFCCLLLATTGIIGASNAQDTLLTIPKTGRLDSIQSAILQQKRYIQVFTPAGYTAGSTEKYDVLYVLDGGNWNIGLVSQVQRFIEGEGNMPPTIIVSVMGIDRNVELTPTHLDNWKGSGGADNFLGYITKELIPYINTHYPSNGDNTLWGHSLGGMFVGYAMLNAPASFTSYIAVDPSMWWDNCLVPKMAAAKFPNMKDLNATLYISGREGGDLHSMRIDTMELVLKQWAPAGLKWKLVPYADETHSSLRLKTTYDGLKFTYAGLSGDIEFVPMNGILLKDKPIKLWYFDDMQRMHYTLDGKAPTVASAKVEREISVAGPATVTFTRFTNRSRYDKSVKGDFPLGEALKPVAKPKAARAGGFRYSYYEGDWKSWPDLKPLTPVKTGFTDKDFDASKLPRKNNYALLVDGLFEAKEDGYYMFILQADKGSKLYVGEKLLMEWDGGYRKLNFTYMVPLKKGFYPLRLEYLHQKEDFKLALVYLTPGSMDSKQPVPIPVDLQYSR